MRDTFFLTSLLLSASLPPEYQMSDPLINSLTCTKISITGQNKACLMDRNCLIEQLIDAQWTHSSGQKWSEAGLLREGGKVGRGRGKRTREEEGEGTGTKGPVQGSCILYRLQSSELKRCQLQYQINLGGKWMWKMGNETKRNESKEGKPKWKESKKGMVMGNRKISHDTKSSNSWRRFTDQMSLCPLCPTVCVSEQQIKLVARKAERRTPDRIVPRELDYVNRERGRGIER